MKNLKNIAIINANEKRIKKARNFFINLNITLVNKYKKI